MDRGAEEKTYKIGQAAKMLDVKPFVLRFWEGEFKDVLVPVRTPSGQRAYTEHNVATVRRIKTLLYDEGLTIEGAKKRLTQEADASAPAHAPTLDAVLSPLPGPAPARCAPAPNAAEPAFPREPLYAETLRAVAAELAAIRDLLK
jgi:DNA-binding transcriptional MerR regulator